jgi:hypothetical protein
MRSRTSAGQTARSVGARTFWFDVAALAGSMSQQRRRMGSRRSSARASQARPPRTGGQRDVLGQTSETCGGNSEPTRTRAVSDVWGRLRAPGRFGGECLHRDESATKATQLPGPCVRSRADVSGLLCPFASGAQGNPPGHGGSTTRGLLLWQGPVSGWRDEAHRPGCWGTTDLYALAAPRLDARPAAAQIRRRGAAMTQDLGHHISHAQTPIRSGQHKSVLP